MNDLETVLPGLLGELGRDAPHDPELADRARHGVRRRRVLTVGPLAAVLAVCLTLGGIWITRPGGSGTAPVADSALGLPAVGDRAAAGMGPRGIQPTGRQSLRAQQQWLAGRGGLRATRWSLPPLPDRGNKILWVPQETPALTDDLVITGTLEGADRRAPPSTCTARPGRPPSTCRPPAAGTCPSTWGAHTDGIDLRWEPSSSAAPS